MRRLLLPLHGTCSPFLGLHLCEDTVRSCALLCSPSISRVLWATYAFPLLFFLALLDLVTSAESLRAFIFFGFSYLGLLTGVFTAALGLVAHFLRDPSATKIAPVATGKALHFHLLFCPERCFLPLRVISLPSMIFYCLHT